MDRLSDSTRASSTWRRSAQLLHVCGVIVLDPETIPGGYYFDAFKDELERRIDDVPMFHRKLQAGAARHRPPGVGQRRRLRHRPARAPDGAAVAGWGRASWPTCAATSPASRWTGRARCGSSWSSRGSSRARSRLHQDAPLHRRRRLRRQRDLLPVQPRARRAADGDGAEGRRGPRTPGDTELFARGVVTNLAKPVRRGQAGRADGRACSPRPSAAPAAVRRWPRRSRAPRTSFNGTITGHRTIAIEDMSLDEDQGDQERRPARPSTTSSSPCAVARCARYLEERGELPRARCSPRCRSRCAGVEEARAAATRSPRSSPGSAPTSRTRSSGCAHGLRGQHQRQGPPQGDPGRHAAGLGRVRRAAHVRPRRTDGRRRSGWPTPAR